MAAPLMTTLTPELSELGRVIIYVRMYEPSYLDHSARMGICLFTLGKYYNCCCFYVIEICRVTVGFGSLIGDCSGVVSCFDSYSLSRNTHIWRSANI
jgi:hypothetical protein